MISALDETARTLFALAEAVDQRDSHTAGHSGRVACLGVTLAMTLGLEEHELQTIYRGGYLHDIGKVGIPDAILMKAGKLNAQEWVAMRTHAVRGESICSHLTSLAPVLPIIRHHHEKWDGSGYPDGLRGEQIPLLARTLQVVDIYDALVHPRSYKPAFSTEKALRILQDETDLGWRDPAIVKAFCHLTHGAIDRCSNPNLSVMRESLSYLQVAVGNPA